MKEKTIDPQTGEYSRSKGRTTIALDVLLTIARLTTLQTPGVSRMSEAPGGMDRIFRRDSSEGVQISIVDEIVTVNLYIILKEDMNIRDVSRQVQRNVCRAISEMVGMQIDRVNVHVEDIDYTNNNAPIAQV